MRVIEEADEYKLESPQIRPFILFPYSSNQPVDGRDKGSKTTHVPAKE